MAPRQRSRYLCRFSDPLLDRFDLRVDDQLIMAALPLGDMSASLLGTKH